MKRSQSEPEVLSLAPEEIEPFLDRRRYSALVPIRLKLDAFLREILSKANQFVRSAAGSILMDHPLDRRTERERTKLYFVAVFGPAASQLLGQSIEASCGAVGYVYRTGEPYLMTDPASDPVFFSKFDRAHGFETRSLIAVPIRIEDTVCGVLELVNKLHGEHYTAQDLELLKIFAGYTSVAIENLLDAQRANEMAKHDDLTGLFNDRFFHHRLSEDLERADKEGGRVALLFLDLDNFKEVNDTHGHLAGSQVLKEFGYLLRKVVQVPGATLARYGGDEFVIILPHYGVEQALGVAEKVLSELRKATFLQGSFAWAEEPIEWDREMTCSLGVAVYPDHVPRQGTTDRKKNLLLRAADQAMYEAKARGKNMVVVAEPVPSNGRAAAR